MGNQPSVQESSSNNSIIAHSKFKNIKFVNNNQILRSRISVENQEEVLVWDKKLKDVADCDDEYLFLPKSYTYTKKAICGSSGILEIDYDNYPYLLSDQISNREPVQNYFTETQLWYLLYCLVSSTSIFKVIGTKVGDIRPNNIFINQCGQIRVASLCSWPSQSTNYQKTIYNNQLTYLSPQEIQDSKTGKINITNDKFISQSFTVGLTLLEAGLLRSNTVLYDFRQKQKSFNFQELKKRINKWFSLTMTNQKEEYSWILKVTIAALCETNPKERLTCSAVYQWLTPYDVEISNLRPVRLSQPPIRNIEKYESIVQRGKQTIYSTINNSLLANERYQQYYYTPQISLKSNDSVCKQGEGRFNTYNVDEKQGVSDRSNNYQHLQPNYQYHNQNQEQNYQQQQIYQYHQQQQQQQQQKGTTNNNYTAQHSVKTVYHNNQHRSNSHKKQQRWTLPQQNFTPYQQQKQPKFVVHYRPQQQQQGNYPHKHTLLQQHPPKQIITQQQQLPQNLYTFHKIPQNGHTPHFSNLSSVRKKQSIDMEDSSLDFLRKINQNIHRSQQKYLK